MIHELALAWLRAEAAAYAASEGVTGSHPGDGPHPAMAAARARMAWLAAGCPVEVPDRPTESDSYPSSTASDSGAEPAAGEVSDG